MIRIWDVTAGQCKEIHLRDLSSLDAITRQLPEGYYSTFRTYNDCTCVIGLTAHLRRLPNVDASTLRRNLLPLLEPYRPGEARIRVMMTKQGQLYVSIEPLKLLPRDIYEIGVVVETAELLRAKPRLKSTTFISESQSERKHIARAGIFEALLVKNGRILEGMTSNFFYTRAERSEERFSRRAKSTLAPAASAGERAQRQAILYTAQNDILLGVTRRTVIRVARGRGVDVKYQPLKLDQLQTVEEAFITSSSRGIVPVVQIDDVKVGQGRVGRITKELIRAYDEYVLSHAEKID